MATINTGPTPVVAGQVKLVSAGTAVSLGSSRLNNGVVVKAAQSNAGTITVGSSSVNNTVDGTGNGYPLAAGEAISFDVDQLGDLYINGTASGDWVSFAGN